MKSLLFTCTMLCSLAGYTQVSNYTFNKETGQPWEIIQYPDIVITDHTVSDDLVLPAKIKIPFPFMFNGTIYDSVGISENGFVWFGDATPEQVSMSAHPISDDHPASVKGIISAMGADLHPHTSPALTTIKSGITGQSPMRELIIEWKNTSRADNIQLGSAPDTITFQVKLYEFMNRVEVPYIRCDLNPAFNTSVQAGIRGSSINDFNNRTTIPSGTNWQNSSKGNDRFADCELSATHFPVFGDMYVWMNLNQTGVREIPDNRFRIYPNPVKDLLHIRNHTGGLLIIKAYDITGKLLASFTSQADTSINTSEWKPGIYLVNLTTAEGNTSTRKVIVE